MGVTLPKYLLKVPSETTRFRDLGKELREMGISIESILESFDYNGTDQNLVLSRVASLEAWRTAAEYQIAALEAKAADTGWQYCTLAPGISQQGTERPRVRRIGNRVSFRWGVSGTGIAASSTRDVFTIPEGFAPPDFRYFQIAAHTAAASAQASVSNLGMVTLRTSASSGSYYLFDGVEYLLD